ncbi:MAG: hypothetical protein R2709_11860 [Marmoricola sp.]
MTYLPPSCVTLVLTGRFGLRRYLDDSLMKQVADGHDAENVRFSRKFLSALPVFEVT